MSVLLADRSLGVRYKTQAAPDSHGDRFTASWGVLVGPWPGRALEGPDVPVGQVGGREWILAVDPAAWPLNQGDMVVELESGQTVRQWLVNSADLFQHTVDGSINYIRVEAHARTSVTTGSTRP